MNLPETSPPTWLLRAVGQKAPALCALARVASALGMRLYLVGGRVRDWLRPLADGDRVFGDLDVMVEGDARTLAQHAKLRLGGDILRHSESFLTVCFKMPSGEIFDIATARTETYVSPGALPVVRPAQATDDLLRRDVSINALAVLIEPDVQQASPAILDPSGGLADLAKGNLRALHPASFLDDPTRIYRVLRLAARLNFSLTSETAGWLEQALADHALATLSPERRGHELARLWQEPRPLITAQWLSDYGVSDPIFESSAIPVPKGCLARAVKMSQMAYAKFRPLLAKLEMSHLCWLVLGLEMEATLRRQASRLVAPTSGALPLWLEGPERLQAARAALLTADPGIIATTLRELHPAERAVLGVLPASPAEFGARAACKSDSSPSPFESQVIWYETEGQHLKTSVRAKALLADGVPRGPALGEALTRAQLAAWRGASEDAQWHAARDSGSFCKAPN